MHRETSRDALSEFIVSMEKMGRMFTFLVYRKKKSPNLYAKKFDGLLVNNDKTVNKIICDLGKVTKSPPNLKL